MAFYDDGVGTEELKPLKLLGGAFGWGLARNVRNLYKQLVRVYEPDDNIYMFGFSRGAFTVRTLAELIASEGILVEKEFRKESRPDKALELAVLQLYENYRAKHKALLESIVYTPFMRFFFNAYGNSKPIIHGDESKKIEFIGVWDTVDAVGLPFDKATDLWNHLIFRFKFPNQELNANIKKAYHALSIDDQRKSFHPLLWENDERIEQVWFPGVHANVGGGYPQQGLSLVALDWMMEHAKDSGLKEDSGLQFIPDKKAFVHDQKYAFDKLYDSRAGVGVYYRYQPRDIAKLCRINKITLPRIHVSAFQRIGEGIFGYAPGNLPDNFEVVDDNGTHKNSERIRQLVSPEPTNDLSSPLLQEVQRQIYLRRGIYYAFLVYSLFTLYWLVRGDIQGKAPLEALGIAIKALAAPESLLGKLSTLFWSNSWLTLIGVSIFAVAVHVRSKMEETFTTFWSEFRSEIRKQFSPRESHSADQHRD